MAALAINEPATLTVSAPYSAPQQQQLRERQTLPTTTAVADAEVKAGGRTYVNFAGFPFPLGPFFQRQTVETELVKDRVYSFEQTLDLSGIQANQRCTVFRMRDNHLLVYDPIAPTDEFIKQLEALNSDGVSHILLGATQYEHKVFVGPFARKFPNAKVWTVPDQWAFPIDIPPTFLGIDVEGSGGGFLVDTASGAANYARAPDLTSEFEVKLLRPPSRLGFGYAANEAALLHKDTKTLALTDALVNVPGTPQPVYTEASLKAIGDNARDTNSLGNLILKAAGAVNWQGTAAADTEALWEKSDAQGADSDSALQRGWERNALLSLYFGPGVNARGVSTIVDPNPSFETLKDKWIVAPVTDTLIYRSERVRPEIARWVDDVTKWDFTLIAPGHFTARPGTPEDMKAAFANTISGEGSRLFPEGDVKLLDDAARALKFTKII